MFLYILVILNISRPLGIWGWAFGNFVVTLYIFPRFGILHKEKSGNPVGRVCDLGKYWSLVLTDVELRQ
jgi:hypothetical protein